MILVEALCFIYFGQFTHSSFVDILYYFEEEYQNAEILSETGVSARKSQQLILTWLGG